MLLIEVETASPMLAQFYSHHNSTNTAYLLLDTYLPLLLLIWDYCWYDDSTIYVTKIVNRQCFLAIYMSSLGKCFLFTLHIFGGLWDYIFLFCFVSAVIILGHSPPSDIFFHNVGIFLFSSFLLPHKTFNLYSLIFLFALVFFASMSIYYIHNFNNFHLSYSSNRLLY